MKKILKGLVIILLIGGVFSFIACNKKTKEDDQKFTSLVNDVYSTNIIASMNLLTTTDGSSSVKLSRKTLNSGNNLNYEELADLASSMSTLVDDVKNSYQVVKSDLKEYETKILYKGTSLENLEAEYVIYYNEKLVESDGWDEKEYAIKGIARKGTEEYTLVGKKETEGNEFELELEILVDNKNFVKVSQETENNEVEYSYEVVKDGKVVNEFEFDFEKGDELKIEIERQTETGLEEIEIKKDDLSGRIRIAVKKQGTTYHLVLKHISDATGNYYEFTDINTKEVIKVSE